MMLVPGSFHLETRKGLAGSVVSIVHMKPVWFAFVPYSGAM